MQKILISLSAKKTATKLGKKTPSEKVKKAKAILKAANLQQNKETMSSYKAAEKQLATLRRQKDKAIRDVQIQIDKLQLVLKKAEAYHDSKLQRAISQRDKAAAKAGVIIQPRATRNAEPKKVAPKEQPVKTVKKSPSHK
jgi:hypothetical protein